MEDLDKILWKLYNATPLQVTSDVQTAKSAITELINQEVVKAEQNAVAWAVGVIDEMHRNDISLVDQDRTYKGVKNTLRDRFKTITGIDPAPNYPIKVKLLADTESMGGE